MNKFGILILVFGLFACGGPGGGSSDSSPIPTTGDLIIQNDSSHVIDEIYLVTAGNSVWGLPYSTVMIPNKTSADFSVPVGSYDVKLIVFGQTSKYYAVKMGFKVPAGGKYTLIANDSSFSGTITVTNTNALLDIVGLYVDPLCGGGTNLLSSNLVPIQSKQIPYLAPGNYCIRTVDAVTGFYYDVTAAVFSLTNISVNVQ